MDSIKSDSPRIKWPSNSPETHLRVPYAPTQPTSKHSHEHKEIENDDNNNEQSQPEQQTINDENNDNNVPFHLSHHHLSANHKKLQIHDSSSPQTTIRSSTSSIGSSQPNINNIYTYQYHRNTVHSHHMRNNTHDKLQRKVQKLEQDILSKNIQHDIMVNKEDMMGKRLKTKDIRIKNLQNDIHKLREQLTVKNETQEKLITEMSELQAQNRGLNNKLRESNIGLNMCNISGDNINHYNESMRDMLLNITTDINQLKEYKQSDHCIKDIVQSCLAPIVQQMKEQQNGFINVLKNDQSEWMNTTMIQINQNMSKFDMDDNDNDNDNDNNNEMMNIINNKLNEMDKNNKLKFNDIKQNIKSLNGNYFQTFFIENNKLMKQNEQILINELKQDIKKEIYNIKSELISNINKTKNEIDLNINKLSNDIKYQIPIYKNKNKNKNNNENINNNANININNIELQIESQTDIINKNALKINNFGQLINNLCANNKNMNKNIEQQLSIQHNKFKQISDASTSKTSNAILALKPLFSKLYEYFQKTDNKIIENIQQNNNDIIQSFTQFKHEFKKIIESIINSKSQSQSFDSNTNTNTKNEYEILLKEIKNINTFIKNKEKTSEFNIISKNMQQITRRHDEIVKIITNTLPTHGNNQIKEMYNNLSKAIECMNNWHQININKTNNNNNNNNKPSIMVSNQSMSIKFDKLLQEIN